MPTRRTRIADADARPDASCCPTSAPTLRSKLSAQARRRANGSPSTRRARCSTASSCAAASRRTCARSASTCELAPNEATCAAARPAPTRCCSPSSPIRCATASSAHLAALEPQTIVSANIGCIQHLQTGTRRRCATGSRCWTRRSPRADADSSNPNERARARATRSSPAPPAWPRHRHSPPAFEGEEAASSRRRRPTAGRELIVHVGTPYEGAPSTAAGRRSRASSSPASYRPLRAAPARRGLGARRALHAGRGLGLRRRAAAPPAPIAGSRWPRCRARPRPRPSQTRSIVPACSPASTPRQARDATPRAPSGTAARAPDRPPRPRPSSAASPCCRRAKAGCRWPSWSCAVRARASANCSAACRGRRHLRRAPRRRRSGCAGCSRPCAKRRSRPGRSGAQAAGFFDHPQMARDFRRLIGRDADALGEGRPPASPPASPTPMPERSVANVQAGPAAPTAMLDRLLLRKDRSMRWLTVLLASRRPPALHAAPAPDLLVAVRRLAPLPRRRDRRGALARAARRADDRRQPDLVEERQGDLGAPAPGAQRRRLDLLGFADGPAAGAVPDGRGRRAARRVRRTRSTGFPARVVYWREGEELLARIEGTLRDKPAAIEWRFRPRHRQDRPTAP